MSWIYDTSKAVGKSEINCHDCQHKDEVKLPTYLADGREYVEHLCHNNPEMICKGVQA